MRSVWTQEAGRPCSNLKHKSSGCTTILAGSGTLTMPAALIGWSKLIRMVSVWTKEAGRPNQNV